MNKSVIYSKVTMLYFIFSEYSRCPRRLRTEKLFLRNKRLWLSWLVVVVYLFHDTLREKWLRNAREFEKDGFRVPRELED